MTDDDIRALLDQHDALLEAARLREIDCALLETRVAALEAALRNIANLPKKEGDDGWYFNDGYNEALAVAHDIARRALGEYRT